MNRLFSVPFDLQSGLSPGKSALRRSLSDLRGLFLEEAALDQMVRSGNPLVYEFYDLGLPEQAAHVAFGTSIVYPGKVGDEYFLTRGHFHRVLETGEVYYCLRGLGFILMENPEGEWRAEQMSAGMAVYVPPRFAHRSINVSSREPLVSFFAFRADAGHDYGTIATNGFRKRIIERNGAPEIVDNPRTKKTEPS